MPDDFSLKRGDRLPSIQATLSADLTTATSVSFIMRPVGGNVATVNAPAVVVDAAGGVVRYDWATPDTAVPGQFEAEWEVLWTAGKTQTFPTLTYHTVAILADLDED